MLKNALIDPTFWLGAVVTILATVLGTLLVQWIGGRPKIVWSVKQHHLTRGVGENGVGPIILNDLVVINFGRKQASDLKIIAEGKILSVSALRSKRTLWGELTTNLDEKPISQDTLEQTTAIGYGHLGSNEMLRLSIWTNYIGGINSVRSGECVGEKAPEKHVFYREVDLWFVVLRRALFVLLFLFLLAGKPLLELMEKRVSS